MPVASRPRCTAQASPSGVRTPDPVFANIGKLLLATQIYDMQRLAHHVSGGMIVTLPGPDEDHNPATAGRLSEVLTARSDIPYEKRIEVARFIEDLTASYQAGWYSVISLHGGGSPEAMKMEIYRNYPIGNRVDLVERLLDRGILADATRKITRNRQPGRCCATGCLAPGRAADGGAADPLATRRGEPPQRRTTRPSPRTEADTSCPRHVSIAMPACCSSSTCRRDSRRTWRITRR